MFTELITAPSYKDCVQTIKNMEKFGVTFTTKELPKDVKVSHPGKYSIYKYIECGHTFHFLDHNIKNKNLICKPCRAEKVAFKSSDIRHVEGGMNSIHVAEAIDHGITLLSRTNHRCYGYYRLSCGHKTYLHYGAIRKAKTNGFKCTPCLDILLHKDAANTTAGIEYNQGVEYSHSSVRSYTFPCGHIRELKTGNVRRNQVSCIECTENRFKQEATIEGLVMVGQPEDTTKRSYLLPCGHTKDMVPAAVRDSNWKCRICQEDKYEIEAKAVGLTMHRDIKSSHYDYRVYTMSCGCRKEIAIACVRRVTFECKNHSTRFIDFSVPISVYLAKFTLPIGEYLKVGFAMDVASRMKRYGLDGEVRLLASVEFSNGQDAVDYEKLLHHKYKHLCINKELVRDYMENGFTECYPMSMYNELYERITERF